jgi:hypothetical protein
MKRHGKPKIGSDNAIMKAYITYRSKCFRKEGGKLVNGAYVENEMIAAVAKQNGIIIKVAARSFEHLQVLTPQGTFRRFDDEEVEQSPFFLWCTGGHYQAIVRLSDVEVLDTALSKVSFTEGTVLSCDDIRT